MIDRSSVATMYQVGFVFQAGFLTLWAAVRLRDDRLEQLRVDPLLDPVRNEPRFQAIERQLKFPN